MIGELAARLAACKACIHRRDKLCRMVAEDVNELAMRPAAICLAGAWPTSAIDQTGSQLYHGEESAAGRQLTPKATGKPRVGFVYPMWQPIGGVERWTISLVTRSRKLEFTGIVGTEPSLLDRPAAGRIRKLIPVSGREGIERLKAESDILIVWGHASGIEWLSGYQGKVVAIQHNTNTWEWDQFGCAAKHAAGFVAVSEAAKESVDEMYRDRVTVIHNGIELDRLAPSCSAESVRKGLGIEQTQKIVLALGRLSEEKNPLAAALAVSRMPDAVAVYVAESQNVKSAAYIDQARLITGGRVKWVQGWDIERIGDLYQIADVAMIASDWEGGPLTYGEAAFCGIPIVSTPVGWIPELETQYGMQSIRVPARPRGRNSDAGQLAAACREAMTITPETLQFNRAVIYRHFSATAFAAKWDAYLCGLLG